MGYADKLFPLICGNPHLFMIMMAPEIPANLQKKEEED